MYSYQDGEIIKSFLIKTKHKASSILVTSYKPQCPTPEMQTKRFAFPV